MTSQLPNAESPSPVEPDEVNAGVLSVVGTFLAVVVVLIALFIEAWFYDWRGRIAQERTLPSNSPETSLGRAMLEDQAKINSYHWVNREAGVRAIPVDRAMEVVAAEMAAAQSTSEEHGKK